MRSQVPNIDQAVVEMSSKSGSDTLALKAGPNALIAKLTDPTD